MFGVDPSGRTQRRCVCSLATEARACCCLLSPVFFFYDMVAKAIWSYRSCSPGNILKKMYEEYAVAWVGEGPQKDTFFSQRSFKPAWARDDDRRTVRAPLSAALNMDAKMSARQTERHQSAQSEMYAAMQQAWVVYHLAASVSELLKQAGNNVGYSNGVTQRVALDIQHFVLAACPVCHAHHKENMRPLLKACSRHERSTGAAFDCERFVFDLHNDVNRARGTAVMPEDRFAEVREHYRGAAQRFPRGLPTATAMSRAMPVLVGRYCYDCGVKG